MFFLFLRRARILFSSPRELVLLPPCRTRKIIRSARQRTRAHVYNVARPVRPSSLFPRAKHTRKRYARRRGADEKLLLKIAVLHECKIWKWNFCGIDKSRNLLDLLSVPHSHSRTVHYTFKILSLHTCARRTTACYRKRKKEKGEGEKKKKKKSRRGYVFA